MEYIEDNFFYSGTGRSLYIRFYTVVLQPSDEEKGIRSGAIRVYGVYFFLLRRLRPKRGACWQSWTTFLFSPQDVRHTSTSSSSGQGLYLIVVLPFFFLLPLWVSEIEREPVVVFEGSKQFVLMGDGGISSRPVFYVFFYYTLPPGVSQPTRIAQQTYAGEARDLSPKGEGETSLCTFGLG